MCMYFWVKCLLLCLSVLGVLVLYEYVAIGEAKDTVVYIYTFYQLFVPSLKVTTFQWKLFVLEICQKGWTTNFKVLDNHIKVWQNAPKAS